MNIDKEMIAELSKSNWAFKEAHTVLESINNKTPEKGYVLFESGYGPSGLPHIGTFGEVVRTTMVMKAFHIISNIPTKLFCFSDDMDGMRKIPDTIPNKEDYYQYMGRSLTDIPDPFKTHESFGHHMNNRLQEFLNTFGFKYEFISSTECYKSGKFNSTLLKALECYDQIMDVMLPTLGEERQKTYSLFLPVSPRTREVLQVPIVSHNVKKGTVSYIDPETQELTEVPVTDGHCKLQWKVDFAMRWKAFDVNFEMYGKDHLANGHIYSKLCTILGGKPPVQMFYELFLDLEGQKISKSKGNGFTIEEWLKYAPQESLSLFMYTSPQKAKKLGFEIVPRFVDDYVTFLDKYHKAETEIEKLKNPVTLIHGPNNVPKIDIDFSYSLLLNLVNACNSNNPNIIWGYLIKFTDNPDITKSEFAQKMVNGAINYYFDYIEPNKKYRQPTNVEREMIEELAKELEQLYKAKTASGDEVSAEEIQSIAYEIAKKRDFDMRTWFQTLYEVLLGASQGPRFGSFVALYGMNETLNLIKTKLGS